MKRKAATLVTGRSSKRAKTSQQLPSKQEYTGPVFPDDIFYAVFPHCDTITLFMLYHVLAKKETLAKALRECITSDAFLPRKLDEEYGGYALSVNTAVCYRVSAILGYSNVMHYLFPIVKQTVQPNNEDFQLTSLASMVLEAAELAAKVGQVMSLQVASQHLRNTPVTTQMNSSVTFQAAKHGNFECLKCAHLNGYSWSSTVPLIAAKYDHFQCFKYAIDNGCPYNKETLQEVAYFGAGFPDHGPFVDYALKLGLFAKVGLKYLQINLLPPFFILSSFFQYCSVAFCGLLSLVTSY